MNADENTIPVIDIFAGPGGLSEGFSAYRPRNRTNPFRVKLSIEADGAAHSTLKLRAFFRQFTGKFVPEKYYMYLQGKLSSVEELYAAFPNEAKAASEEAWHGRLGKIERTELDRRIRNAVNTSKYWILIGGPPCQAYSLAGRSRRTHDEKFESDEKHLLYREYLQIIDEHQPPVFVMENVKGLLSATLSGLSTFDRILKDLKRPRASLSLNPDQIEENGPEYYIYSLSTPVEYHEQSQDLTPSDYLIRCEDYGVPQARHRLILLGIRKGFDILPAVLDKQNARISLWKAISDLPRLRSGISKARKMFDKDDSFDLWLKCLSSASRDGCLSAKEVGLVLYKEIKKQILAMSKAKILTTGNDGFLPREGKVAKQPMHLPRWYYDRRIGGVCNHSSKRHRIDDIFRYFFCACFGTIHGRPPQLKDFPTALLPKHKNVQAAILKSLFSDRFRVQMKGRPATTLTCHIAKDGHYFIHPDPRQCRSLTVREAARIQTFPDNYFFEGTRTEQYQQIGNAVPPILAKQIADVVFRFLSDLRRQDHEQTKRTQKLEHVPHSVGQYET